jgi:hypothetical protein
MIRRREQIVLELKKLRAGAHPADCGCWECRRIVSDVLTRRHLGEMLDPRDQASADEWGTAG